MMKIGILLQSTNCSDYFYRSVRDLATSGQVDLYFLVNANNVAATGTRAMPRPGRFARLKQTCQKNGFSRTANAYVFRILTRLEHRFLSRFNPHLNQLHQERCIGEFSTHPPLLLNPIFSPSGLVVRYPDADVETLQALDLDLIVRGNAPGIFKGRILQVAKYGFLSFHHGDNRWNRGGPPAFWEVYLRKTSTGFLLQILNEELDGGAVVFRGSLPTQRSYTENLAALYRDSYPYLATIVLRYADGPLPKQTALPFGGPILTTPSVAKSITYVAKTTALFLRSKIGRNNLLRKRRTSSVAFLRGPWQQATLRKGVPINNPEERFFSTPFIANRDDKTVCFVTDHHCRDNHTCISAIEISGNKSYTILGSVIGEPFQTSHPFLFEYQQQLYMVPETRQANAVRLYKCVEFPRRWQYQNDLLSDVSATGATIFFHQKQWWLLCNTNVSGSDSRASTLSAFYANTPLSDNWHAHSLNPLVFNNETAGNGGLLDGDREYPVRPRKMQGFNHRDSKLSLARIRELTPHSFHEDSIGTIDADFFPGIDGCHHIHSNGTYLVYDFTTRQSLW